MTKKEFDQAVEAIREGKAPSTDAERRVLAALRLLLRKARDIPEEQYWLPTQPEIAEFIDTWETLAEAGEAAREAESAKQIADGLTLDKDGIH